MGRNEVTKAAKGSLPGRAIEVESISPDSAVNEAEGREHSDAMVLLFFSLLRLIKP